MTEGGPPPPDEPDARVHRRAFFRAFVRDALNTAVTVVGAADAVRQGTKSVAGGMLGPGLDERRSAEHPVEAQAALHLDHRGPYQVGDGFVSVLDQRKLPFEAVEIECRTSGDIVAALRSLAARGGPLVGELAAYGMALAAERSIDAEPNARNVSLREAAEALVNARPDVAAVVSAVDRCLEAWRSVSDPDDGAEVHRAIREVADSLAAETAQGLARLCRDGAALLRHREGRALEILTIDDTGPLSGGVVGTALGIVETLAADGATVHVWLAETRPWRTGARLAASELMALGVACTVIADGAIGWPLRERTIDAVLVGAERIAANGDFANAAGTYPIAVLAARHGVPFYVCAPLTSVDVEVADGAGLTIVWRPASELLDMSGERSLSADLVALVPLDDMTPADLVTAYVTDRGVLQPPFAGSVVELARP